MFRSGQELRNAGSMIKQEQLDLSDEYDSSDAEDLGGGSSKKERVKWHRVANETSTGIFFESVEGEQGKLDSSEMEESDSDEQADDGKTSSGSSECLQGRAQLERGSASDDTAAIGQWSSGPAGPSRKRRRAGGINSGEGISHANAKGAKRARTMVGLPSHASLTERKKSGVRREVPYESLPAEGNDGRKTEMDCKIITCFFCHIDIQSSDPDMDKYVGHLYSYHRIRFGMDTVIQVTLSNNQLGEEDKAKEIGSSKAHSIVDEVAGFQAGLPEESAPEGAASKSCPIARIGPLPTTKPSSSKSGGAKDRPFHKNPGDDLSGTDGINMKNMSRQAFNAEEPKLLSNEPAELMSILANNYEKIILSRIPLNLKTKLAYMTKNPKGEVKLTTQEEAAIMKVLIRKVVEMSGKVNLSSKTFKHMTKLLHKKHPNVFKNKIDHPGTSINSETNKSVKGLGQSLTHRLWARHYDMYEHDVMASMTKVDAAGQLGDDDISGCDRDKVSEVQVVELKKNERKNMGQSKKSELSVLVDTQVSPIAHNQEPEVSMIEAADMEHPHDEFMGGCELQLEQLAEDQAEEEMSFPPPTQDNHWLSGARLQPPGYSMDDESKKMTRHTVNAEEPQIVSYQGVGLMSTLDDNYDTLVLSKIPHNLKYKLANLSYDSGIKLTTHDQSALMKVLIGEVVELSGKEEISSKMFQQMAQLLEKKHPSVFQSQENTPVVNVGASNASAAIYLPVKANQKALRYRLQSRHYDMFRRDTVVTKKKVEKANQSHEAEEPDCDDEESARQNADSRVEENCKRLVKKRKMFGMVDARVFPVVRNKDLESMKMRLTNEVKNEVEEETPEALRPFIQAILTRESVSSLKSYYPSFFASCDQFQRHFNFLSNGTDIFQNAVEHLDRQMELLEVFLKKKLPAEQLALLQSQKAECALSGQRHKFYMHLFGSLCQVWKMKLQNCFFMTDDHGVCNSDVPEPHAVIVGEDFSSIDIYCDFTPIFQRLTLLQAIPALVGLHMAASLHYHKESYLLLEYLQKQVCILSPLEGTNRPSKVSLKVQSSQIQKFQQVIAHVLYEESCQVMH